MLNPDKILWSEEAIAEFCPNYVQTKDWTLNPKSLYSTWTYVTLEHKIRSIYHPNCCHVWYITVTNEYYKVFIGFELRPKLHRAQILTLG